MNKPAAYFPHALFSTEGMPAPRVFVSPQRYIQGEGVIDQIGRYLSLVEANRAGLLISKRGQREDGKRIIASMENSGIEPVISTFNGECSLNEIELHASSLAGQSVDCLIAAGGGKCVDAGKSIAYRLDVPLIVVPTLASNDAPCSAVSVLYSPEGVFAGAEFFPQNPAIVIVDTGVVAKASERYLVAGMGDAMATWYEARTCLNNTNARSTIGARPTLAACAIGEMCANTLFEDGIAAARAVAENRVDESLERVVEANTLLSGIGFESGGLAVAHGVAQSYTEVKVVHDNYLHGEMVAMGTLTQLVMESENEARQVAEFFAKVGLPVHLGQISLGPDDPALDAVIKATMASSIIHNMQMPMTADFIRSSIVKAHNLGLSVAESLGDSAYVRLRG